jgi:hypothetical protein
VFDQNRIDNQAKDDTMPCSAVVVFGATVVKNAAISISQQRRQQRRQIRPKTTELASVVFGYLIEKIKIIYP